MTEKIKPELIAHAIFVPMLKKRMVKTSLDNLSPYIQSDKIDNQNVELELKYLTVFSKHYAIETTVKDIKLRHAILEAFYVFISLDSEDYFGYRYEAVSERLDMRVKSYLEALSKRSPDGPAYDIGKNFTRFIGCNEYDIRFIYLAGLHFTAESNATEEALDKILKKYSVDLS